MWIQLNVGGVIFETLDSTLKRYPDSMLAKCLEISTIQRDKEGRIFIDRNPKLFAKILHMLRNDPMAGPTHHQSCFVSLELASECEYYMLPWQQTSWAIDVLDGEFYFKDSQLYSDFYAKFNAHLKFCGPNGHAFYPCSKAQLQEWVNCYTLKIIEVEALYFWGSSKLLGSANLAIGNFVFESAQISSLEFGDYLYSLIGQIRDNPVKVASLQRRWHDNIDNYGRRRSFLDCVLSVVSEKN